MESFLIHLADSVELDCIWRAGEVCWVSLSAGEERAKDLRQQHNNNNKKNPA